MKKVINGKIYDTDKATHVGEYSNGKGMGDFKRLEESLYQKLTGEFFLYGSGGAMTKYSVAVGNAFSGGSKIVPLTLELGMDWVERYLDTDTYIELFGEPEE